MEREQSVEEKNIRELPLAMLDDFRGFIVDGTRVPVKDDELHALIALKEMEKIPEWKYEHGVGRDVIAELLYLRQAIYITRIKIDKNNYQRTIAYCKDVYSQEIEYQGKQRKLLDVIKAIAMGNGYDVDEYKVDNPEKYKFKVTNYSAEMTVKRSRTKQAFHKSFSEGDKPIFSGDTYIGFLHNGKFYSAKRTIEPKKRANKEKNIDIDENPGNGEER